MLSKEQSGMERADKEPVGRLETDLIFMRHGVAEKLKGADEKSAIDAQRLHTEEGTQQVYEGGKKAAADLNLNPQDQVVIVSRSSPRERAKQTVDDGLKGFLEQLHAQGLQDENIDRQTSVKPERKAFDYGNHTTVYGAGGSRKGSTKGLSEQWARNPDLLQTDIDTALELARKDNPKENPNAESLLTGMRESYQNTVALVNRATTILAKKWERKNAENLGAKPPRLVVLEGAHGFVTEPWLKEVVKDYEQKTNEQLPLELGYGGFWRIHWSSNPKEQPVLHIGVKEIPISQEHLNKLEKMRGWALE